MKKIVSIVLTMVMIVSMFATVSAASVNDLTSYIPNPLEMELAVGVLARKSGTTDVYADSLELTQEKLPNGVGVDYKATLDMEPIRLLFDKQFVTTVLEGDASAKDEFDAANVVTEVTVKITYPESASFASSLETAGELDAGSIFSEMSRSAFGNTLTIVYQNEAGLTVGELTEHKDTYLKNIAFYLENELSYHTEGDHTVTVEMEGATTISFASKTQIVEYSGEASHIAKVNPRKSGSVSGGGVAGLYPTIKFHVNGGDGVEKIVVQPGEKITLPIPTREGYTFAGWYTDLALTIPFDPEAEISGTLTLYAKWIEGSAGPCDGTEAMNCPCLKFVDLDPTQWYHLGVDYVLNNGLMIGTEETTFEPDSSLTRAMLVTVLWRAEGEVEAAEECKFADVENGSYYEEAVAWAEECGIVTGYNDTEFGPHDNILREQIAAIMYRYSKFKGYDVSAGEDTNILSYTDVAEISEYAIPAMQYAVGSGLMNGRTETTLNPQNDTTRAEIAVILYRFFTAHQ